MEEVVINVIYALNKCPTKSIHGKTHQEAWSQRKLNISHFKVFGFIAYSYVPNKLRKKLDNKSKNIFLLVTRVRQRVKNYTIQKLKGYNESSCYFFYKDGI